MGICSSCCSDNQMDDIPKIDDQYASLVTVKPPPITLDEIQNNSDDVSKIDVPPFPPVKSDDDDNPVVSDPENLTDVELNLYVQKMNDEDDEEQEKND